MNLSFEHWNQYLDSLWVDTMKTVHRNKDIDQAAKEAWADCYSRELLPTMTGSDFKTYVHRWLCNMKEPKVKPIQRPLHNLQ
jgi:hypothetical protein